MWWGCFFFFFFSTLTTFINQSLIFYDGTVKYFGGEYLFGFQYHSGVYKLIECYISLCTIIYFGPMIPVHPSDEWQVTMELTPCSPSTLGQEWSVGFGVRVLGRRWVCTCGRSSHHRDGVHFVWTDDGFWEIFLFPKEDFVFYLFVVFIVKGIFLICVFTDYSWMTWFTYVTSYSFHY